MADGTLNFDTKVDSSGFEEGANGIGNIVKGLGISKVIDGAISKTMELGKASVQIGMGFESSMSQVAATMGNVDDMSEETFNSLKKKASEMGIAFDENTSATELSFLALSASAKEMGASTQFSASNAADALNYLALAGYDSVTAIDTLPTVLNLAAAGGMELGTASDMVTDAMSALGLESKDASKFVDKMAKTSQKSNTSVSQLGNAILTVGATAKVLKGGTTELSTALGILADNGFKGSEGGTKLRNVIMSLTNPTDTAAEALDGLGVSAFDSYGNMRELPDILEDLNGALDGMSDEQRMNVIGTIFNKADIGAVNSLLGTSRDRWDELGAAIDNSDGAAAEMAVTMNDNLQGALTVLQSSLEGLAIEMYEGFAPALTNLVKFASDSVSKLVTGMQENGVPGAIAAAGEIVGGLAGTFIEKAPEFISNGLEMVENFAMGLINGLPLATYNASQILLDIGSKIIEAYPSIQKKGLDLIAKMAVGLMQSLPSVILSIGNIITGLMDKLIEAFPKMVDNGKEFIKKLSNGVKNNAPTIIGAIGEVVGNVLAKIVENLPEFLAKGVELLGEVAKGIGDNLPAIITAIAGAIADVLAKIGEKLPDFLQKGIDLLGEVATGIVNAVPDLVGKIPQICTDVINKFGETDWGSIGSAIIDGIKTGVTNAANSLYESITSMANTAWEKVKEIFGIHSPSRAFAYIGRMCDAGLAVGIREGVPQLKKDIGQTMQGVLDSVNTDLNFATSYRGGSVAGTAAAFASSRAGNSIDRLIELQEEGNRNAQRLAKRPIYLGTERIDEELPKGAVPLV